MHNVRWIHEIHGIYQALTTPRYDTSGGKRLEQEREMFRKVPFESSVPLASLDRPVALSGLVYINYCFGDCEISNNKLSHAEVQSRARHLNSQVVNHLQIPSFLAVNCCSSTYFILGLFPSSDIILYCQPISQDNSRTAAKMAQGMNAVSSSSSNHMTNVLSSSKQSTESSAASWQSFFADILHFHRLHSL